MIPKFYGSLLARFAPTVWQSLQSLITKHAELPCKNSGPIFHRLWAKVYEILGRSIAAANRFLFPVSFSEHIHR